MKALTERVVETGDKYKNYEITQEEALIEFGAQKDKLERLKDKLNLHEEIGVTTDTNISFVEDETLNPNNVHNFFFEPHEWNSMTMKKLFGFYLETYLM